MKKITAQELPFELTEEILATLVEMALEFPKKTFDWAEVSTLLEERGQLLLVLDRVEEVKRHRLKETQAEKDSTAEAEKWQRLQNNPDPHQFHGNMGQPETPQEFKNRYGVWPPGYKEE